MKQYPILLAAIVCFSLFTGCISRTLPEVSYYMLDYLPDTETASLKLEIPRFQNVYIDDTELPRAFMRRQIVNRLQGPEYQYLRSHLWGNDLSETVPRLLESRIRAYGIFANPSRQISRNRQELEIISRLERIEFISYGTRSEALVEVEFSLVRTADNTVLVRHTARQSAPVKNSTVRDFVYTANRILLAEIDGFLAKVEAVKTGKN